MENEHLFQKPAYLVFDEHTEKYGTQYGRQEYVEAVKKSVPDYGYGHRFLFYIDYRVNPELCSVITDLHKRYGVEDYWSSVLPWDEPYIESFLIIDDYGNLIAVDPSQSEMEHDYVDYVNLKDEIPTREYAPQGY